MKLIICLLIAKTFFLNPVQAETKSPLQKNDFTSWPKSSVTDFGCFLEKKFSYKDQKFNCSLKKYVAQGDPCKNTTEYYEGPKFPEKQVKEVNPQIEEIDLAWEHGALQNLMVNLKGQKPEAEIRKTFHLPKNAIVEKCGKTNTCVTLIGFEHLGTADTECGDE